jgi:hypothetical protein
VNGCIGLVGESGQGDWGDEPISAGTKETFLGHNRERLSGGRGNAVCHNRYINDVIHEASW